MKTEEQMRVKLKEKIDFKDSFNVIETKLDNGLTRAEINILEWVLK